MTDRSTTLASLLLLALATRPAAGGEDPWRRAGYPEQVSPCARPSDTGRYTGYYVGGGAPCKGEDRTPDEGTWGWDYCGLCFPARIVLRWWHGRCQGGTGAYKTDGPKLLEKLHGKRGHE
jgi:hypothetical protein